MPKLIGRKLCGNENAYKTLANWINGGRLSHAILIEGEKGLGKRTFARDIASAIICENKNLCAACRHCVKSLKGIHPDVLVFKGEGKARSFHIAKVREIIKEAYLSTSEADTKVFILEDAHEMTTEAANALLKLIEEPPKNVVIILTCENKSQMLPTVLSRVTYIALMPLGISECADTIAKIKEGCSKEECTKAAVICLGNVGRALESIDNADKTQLFGEALEYLKAAVSGQELKALSIISKYERKKPEYRDILVFAKNIIVSLISPQKSSEYAEIFAECSLLQLTAIADIIENVISDMDYNINTSVLSSVLCLRIKEATA